MIINLLCYTCDVSCANLAIWPWLGTATAFFARGWLHAVTCNCPCANQAVWSQLRALVAFFAHE